MRYRIWAVIGVILLTVALSSCTLTRVARSPVGTPVPTKTLRPTFTHTPAKPTLIPAPTTAPPPLTSAEPTSAEPTVTPIPPTPAPPTATATPDAASLTVTNATVNVRSGPGTNYANIGRASRGQSFVVTGKNPAGDWYQFDFNGRPGWVIGQLVEITGASRVQVAANILPPPTVAPRPTARPVARPTAQPQTQPQPQPAAFPFVAVQAAPFPNTNDLLTVRCRTRQDLSSDQAPAGSLLITGPTSAPAQPFDTQLVRANTGMEAPMQYFYNENCKVEIRPFVAGTYTGMLVDGGGKQISEPINFTPGGDTREFVLIWKQR